MGILGSKPENKKFEPVDEEDWKPSTSLLLASRNRRKIKEDSTEEPKVEKPSVRMATPRGGYKPSENIFAKLKEKKQSDSRSIKKPNIDPEENVSNGLIQQSILYKEEEVYDKDEFKEFKDTIVGFFNKETITDKERIAWLKSHLKFIKVSDNEIEAFIKEDKDAKQKIFNCFTFEVKFELYKFLLKGDIVSFYEFGSRYFGNLEELNSVYREWLKARDKNIYVMLGLPTDTMIYNYSWENKHWSRHLLDILDNAIPCINESKPF